MEKLPYSVFYQSPDGFFVCRTDFKELEQADEFIADLASHGVTGFWEPLRALSSLIALLRHLKRIMTQRHPTAVICIDYYGFNRRVLSAARTVGIDTFYFVSPQVWASRAGRVQTLKKLISKKMLVIFPFEEILYRKAGIACSYVGHPLLDYLPPARAATTPGSSPLIGLLPGSRSSEILRHLPLFLEAFALFQQQHPNAQALLFAAETQPDSAYTGLPSDGSVKIVREQDYSHRALLDAALCSSGTATLENALLGIPTVVVYKMSWLTHRIARTIIYVKHIAMANILAGKTLMPELIQNQATAHAAARQLALLVADPAKWSALRTELIHLRRGLGQPGAAKRAAHEILAGLGSL